MRRSAKSRTTRPTINRRFDNLASSAESGQRVGNRANLDFDDDAAGHRTRAGEALLAAAAATRSAAKSATIRNSRATNSHSKSGFKTTTRTSEILLEIAKPKAKGRSKASIRTLRRRHRRIRRRPMMVGGTASIRFRSALIGTAVAAAYGDGGEKSSVAACESISVSIVECPSLGDTPGCNSARRRGSGKRSGRLLPVVAASARKPATPAYVPPPGYPADWDPFAPVGAGFNNTISANSRTTFAGFHNGDRQNHDVSPELLGDWTYQASAGGRARTSTGRTRHAPIKAQLNQQGAIASVTCSARPRSKRQCRDASRSKSDAAQANADDNRAALEAKETRRPATATRQNDAAARSRCRPDLDARNKLSTIWPCRTSSTVPMERAQANGRESAVDRGGESVDLTTI